jgi:hypothetical protein
MEVVRSVGRVMCHGSTVDSVPTSLFTANGVWEVRQFVCKVAKDELEPDVTETGRAHWRGFLDDREAGG